MALTPGARLGPYEVTEQIGAGGMGEVYRATDSNLKRSVAIKVLPASVAGDADRLARFQREAEVLAALNHPNIAAIYGFERSSGLTALVMELVDGEDLSQRIARGAIPIDEALRIAKQIAEALEAAHEQGIVHRDLKPANIKVRDDGTVKVLDFGLAKAMDQGSGITDQRSGNANSPTITSPAMTMRGVIMGTAAYMAPEQARGKTVDQRADIWAFGCVLFEMFTGTRAFEGEDIADTLGNVMKVEPRWEGCPASIPPFVVQVMRTCLQKDRRQRIGDMQSVRLALEGAFDTTVAAAPVFAPAAPPLPIWRRVLPVALTVVGCALIGSAAWRLRPEPPAPVVTRFSISLAAGQQFTNAGRQVVAISPDGTQMAYVASSQLWLRPMNASGARPINGTSDLGGVLNPVFSPDGKSIAFWADFTIKRISVDGGTADTVCPADRPFGMSWDSSGILFGLGSSGIARVGPGGGKPEVLVTVSSGEVAHGPQMLPDGQHVLFTLTTGVRADRWDTAQIVVQRLASGERNLVIQGGADARYLPSGHLVYGVGKTIFAVPFDVTRLDRKGEPVPILDGVRRASLPGVNTGIAHISISQEGTLMYVPDEAGAGELKDLVRLDRKGNIDRVNVPPGAYDTPRVSPDGRRLAFGIDDGKAANVWIYDLAGTSAMRRLTFGGNNRAPVWSDDGERVTYQSDREGDLGLFWQRADGTGTAERLLKADAGAAQFPAAWTPGGQTLLFERFDNRDESSLWMYSRASSKAELIMVSKSGNLRKAAIAPSGRWMAYGGSAPDGSGVFVQPLPATGGKFQIAASGHSPVWSRDGRQLLFANAGQLVSVTVSTEPAFTFGSPVTVSGQSIGSIDLSQGLRRPRPFDLAPDGRVIGVRDTAGDASGTAVPQRIEVVLNWFEELKRLVPMK